MFLNRPTIKKNIYILIKCINRILKYNIILHNQSRIGVFLENIELFVNLEQYAVKHKHLNFVAALYNLLE